MTLVPFAAGLAFCAAALDLVTARSLPLALGKGAVGLASFPAAFLWGLTFGEDTAATPALKPLTDSLMTSFLGGSVLAFLVFTASGDAVSAALRFAPALAATRRGEVGFGFLGERLTGGATGFAGLCAAGSSRYESAGDGGGRWANTSSSLGLLEENDGPATGIFCESVWKILLMACLEDVAVFEGGFGTGGGGGAESTSICTSSVLAGMLVTVAGGCVPYIDHGLCIASTCFERSLSWICAARVEACVCACSVRSPQY